MTQVTSEVLGLVYKYSEWMVSLLRDRDNQRKITWRSDEVTMEYLLKKLDAKIADLKVILKDEPRMRLVQDAWHKAADIGNYAWMIADKSEQQIHDTSKELP